MRRWIAIAFAVLILLAALVYIAVPQIQPCALLSRVLPLSLLPPNPNITGLAFDPLPGARALVGQRACSGYRIEVPQHWTGDLVVYAHGFRGATPDLTVTNLPVREAAIRQGFAWAASSYRANGFNPQDGVQDTLLLIEEFKKKVSTPKRVFLYGSSMGGFVVVSSLEQHSEVYSGGVAECGILGGAAQIDYLVSLNTLADYLAGVDMLAQEHKGLKAQLALLRKIYSTLGQPPDFTFDENGLSGQVRPPPSMTLTDKGALFRDAAVHLGGGPRPFAREGFAAAYKLIFEPTRALFGVQPAGAIAAGSNTSTDYQVAAGFPFTSAQLNAGMKRVVASPAERAAFTFTGKLRVPLLTMNDTGDLFVPLINAQDYAKLTRSTGSNALLVQRTVRRFLHCDFSQTERDRAFSDLVAWVRTGVKPPGEDLSGSLLDTGRKWTSPLRPDDPGHP